MVEKKTESENKLHRTDGITVNYWIGQQILASSMLLINATILHNLNNKSCFCPWFI